MKKIKLTLIALAIGFAGAAQGNAQGLSDLFGGGGGSNILGNLIEGVFTSSKITVADMEGTWISTGPAISFKGEGFLKEAGGLAAAATIESKLAPYYKQYGLNGATVTIDRKRDIDSKGRHSPRHHLQYQRAGSVRLQLHSYGSENRHIQNIYPEIVEHYGHDVRRNQTQDSCVGDS